MIKQPYIIAEIASAHEGSHEILGKIVDQLIDIKPNAIKFQIFKTDQLLVKSHPMYDEFNKIFMNRSVWMSMLKKVRGKEIEVIVEPFDNDSFIYAKKEMKIKNFKIPPTNIADLNLIKEIAQDSEKIFLGVGGSTQIEISNAIDAIQETNNEKLILVCGVQSFPTKLEDTKLSQINFLKNKFGLDVCFADHIDAENKELAKLVPILAYNSGANFIEKHINLDRSLKGKDYYSSMNPNEFKDLVNSLRNIHILYGQTDKWLLSEADSEYRKFSKKFAVARKLIIKGTLITEDLFDYKRSIDLGITIHEIRHLVGKTINKDLKRDEVLKSEYLD